MALRYLTAGESHGPSLMAILEGIPAGLDLTEELINRQLKRRQMGFGSGARMKLESDRVEILSGVMGGQTIGSPVTLKMINQNHEKWVDREIPAFSVPRPGHVDLAAAIKYGYRDLRPGLERSSARETTSRVALVAICAHFLSHFGVQIYGYVLSIGDIDAHISELDYRRRFELAEQSDVRCPDENAAEQMRNLIREIIEAQDTLGGVIEVVALGLPAGLGSHVHWERRLDARLSQAVMSVQAIKGIEIGTAFGNSRRRGTQVHDAIRLQGDEIVRDTNRAGGIEGGISNGQPLVLRAAMKPIASTLTAQKSVDLSKGVESETNYERSDTCPVPRAVPVLEAVVALTLADAMIEKLGGDSMQEMLFRYQHLRKNLLADLQMDDGEFRYW